MFIRIAKTLMMVTLVLLVSACGPTATSSPIPLTLSPVPSSATVAPTFTPHPTRTSIPTTSPYRKTPVQTDDGWEVASLVSAGIDPVIINKMLGSIYRGEQSYDTLTLPGGRIKYQNIDGILIVKDGRLVFEEYFNHYTRDSRHDIASVSKSITSLLVGLVIEKDYLENVDKKVLAYFPEYLPFQNINERKENITIEDLLTMRTGMECNDWNPASRTYYGRVLSNRADDVKYILNFPMETAPGSRFAYCTSGTVVLNAMLIKATGMELPIFASRFLFQPMGVKSVMWDSTSGSWKNIDGISFMRPRDMARLGLLMLQNGKWDGKQLVPQSWIEQSTQKHVSLLFNQTWGKWYDYLWWLSNVPVAGKTIHSVSASGHGGQVITIFPDLNMVIVITGSNYENDTGQPFEIMERFILPAILTHSSKPAPTLTTIASSTSEISMYNFPRSQTIRRKIFVLSVRQDQL